VTGPKGGGDVGVVAAALVGILDQQGDRRAGGDLAAEAGGDRLVLEHAGEDAHRVGFAALADELALARAAFVEPDLNVLRIETDPRRAAVDDAAQRRAVALAPGGHAEEMAEAVVRHGEVLLAHDRS